MKKTNTIVFITIFLVTCLIFFKIFLRGLFPVPGDLLVSFYFPWYSGGWEGYERWTTRKELLAADAVRQIYLWKEFAADQFKNGQFPLWNPYTFSGQPLAANFQSSVYYPFNIFYLLTDAKNAWILLIVIQPFLAGLFMYLAARSFKISLAPSLFASTAFMFSSYFITWLENGNISHSYLWLPLAFWSINKYFENFKIRYYLTLTTAFTMAILAGHPQTIIYLLLATTFFWVFKIFSLKRNKFKEIAIYSSSIIISLLLTSIQLIPTIDFYKASPISLPFAKSVFDEFILPVQNLVTFFAADFFGHPASNNFWSKHYGDFTPYFGVLPLIFSLWAMLKLWQNKFVRFASLTATFFIIAALQSPITWLIRSLQIPLLDATSPARFISISIFLLIILGAFGFQDVLNNLKNSKYLKKFLKFLVFIGIFYAILWIITFLGPRLLSPQDIWQINFSVTRRNLILPTAMFASLLFGIIGFRFVEKLDTFKESLLLNFFILSIFVITLFGGVFYSNKFLPAAPKKFIFPDHPIFEWLQNNASINRFYGGGTARIDQNHPIHYSVYGAEGYDTLRFKRYAELIAAGNNEGRVPHSYSRSDAFFSSNENGYRKRLFELLGVKYLLDKEDNPKSLEDWHYERFPNDNVEGHWQQGKFQIYKRDNVLPRSFLTTKYEVLKDDNKIQQKIFDPSFDLTTLILETKPTLEIKNQDNKIIIPNIKKYSPNEVIINTYDAPNSLLFLSDAYSDDWRAFVDGKPTNLLRAHYALRAVAVPEGNHQVVFRYQPLSHILGLYVTSGTSLFLMLLIIISIRKKKF